MRISNTEYKNNKNNKIAILTFHSAYNYGAVLQAYALQEYCNKNLGDTQILDYHNSDIDKSYSKPCFKDLVHNPKRFFFRWIQSTLFKKKNLCIDHFRKEYLRLTRRYNLNNIKMANCESDIFITGSDQVWNHLIIGRDTTFFLDFTEPQKKTCSYAASIGVDNIPEEFAWLYKNAITHIQTISVREKTGVQALASIGVNDVEVMPDPTLLLAKEQWESLAVNPNVKGKYILVYKITKADKLLKFAKMLSKRTGLPVIYIPNDLKSGIIGKLKLNVGPMEWLGYIKNAEYVVTNSFHGSVFSILFGRKFFSEVSEKVNPSTSRLLNLLSLFGLEDRIISRFTDDMAEKELPNAIIKDVCIEQQKRVLKFFQKTIYGEE